MIKVLQKKFILAAMLAVTILLVVLLGVINVFNFVSAYNNIDEALENIVSSSQMGISDFQSGGPFGNFSSFDNSSPFDNSNDQEESEENFAEDSVAYFSITFDSDGIVIRTYMTGIASITQDEAVAMAQQVFETKSVSGTEGNYKYKGYTTNDFSGITYVFLNTDYYKSGILRVVALSVLAGVACWLCMLLLIFFLSKKFINPIAENIEKQKDFITDAGHEIKTPIAIIQANTEAMELFNGENKWSRNIKEQTVRLTGLVSNLLTLSKASDTYEKPVVYDVDITEVINRNVEMFRESAAVKAKLLNFDADESIMVKGDKEQFSRIVSLLLDNAIKYAPPMSEIDIEIIPDMKNVIFKVTNDCEELPECEPERLFDRFYRPDSSHNSSTGGNGIGLATVKAIAGQYGAQASCIYGTDRITFQVSFKKA